MNPAFLALLSTIASHAENPTLSTMSLLVWPAAESKRPSNDHLMFRIRRLTLQHLDQARTRADDPMFCYPFNADLDWNVRVADPNNRPPVRHPTRLVTSVDTFCFQANIDGVLFTTESYPISKLSYLLELSRPDDVLE